MKERTGIKKVIYISCGSISLGLGVLGIFLPLLPTTPFLLLSAACYIRGSKKLYQWLINHKYFGPLIKNYREQKGIELKTKIILISLLWVTISLSAYKIRHIHVCILLFIVAAGVTIHLTRIKTL